MKKWKIGSSGKKRAQERPLHRVERALRARFRCGFKTVICQTRPKSIFSQLQGQKPKGEVLRRLHWWVFMTENPPRRCATAVAARHPSREGISRTVSDSRAKFRE